MRRTSKASLLIAVATALCLAQTATEYDAPDVMHIAGKLHCNCGCNQRMDCQMPPSCPVCKAAKIKIANMMKEGKSEGQILDVFVAENGQQILVIPPGKFAFTAPYLALLMGLGLVFVVIRRYRHLRPAPRVAAGDDAAVARYHDQIEKDLAKLE